MAARLIPPITVMLTGDGEVFAACAGGRLAAHGIWAYGITKAGAVFLPVDTELGLYCPPLTPLKTFSTQLSEAADGSGGKIRPP
jgi:hypothetical protein